MNTPEAVIVRKYLVSCGGSALVAAALVTAMIVYSDLISAAMDWIAGFSTSPAFTVLCSWRDYIGKFHYAAPLSTVLIYAWLSCVWLKLNSKDATIELSYQFIVPITISYLVAVVFLCSYAVNQPGELAKMMAFLAVCVWVSYVIMLLSPRTWKPKEKALTE